MKVNWKNIANFRKVQVLSIEFTEHEINYHVAKLTRVKADIKIVSTKMVYTIDDTIDELNKNQPVIIHVFGKGVLNKTSPLEQNNMNDVLMNSDPKEFYINSLTIDKINYISFTRKDKVDEILKSITEINDNILDIIIGPYHTLIHEINPKISSTPIGNIVLEDGKYIFQFDSINNKVGFDDNELKQSFYAVTAGAAFLLSTKSFGALSSEDLKKRKSNFKDKLQFNYIGVAAISFFLIALVLNYFYQGHLNQKNTDIEARIMVYSQNLNKIDLIDQEITRKKQLISNSGIMRNNYFSFTLDEIGASVPSSITLEELEIYPLEKKLKENVKPIFLRKIIKIVGTANSSENVNTWVNTINTMKWVDNVAILNFQIDENKNIAFFELKITEK